jgi:hypothetical protein
MRAVIVPPTDILKPSLELGQSGLAGLWYRGRVGPFGPRALELGEVPLAVELEWEGTGSLGHARGGDSCLALVVNKGLLSA